MKKTTKGQEISKLEEVINLLSKASHEIQDLRRHNQILKAQMDVVHIFAHALGMKPENQGQCVDVVWEIDRFISRLKTPPQGGPDGV